MFPHPHCHGSIQWLLVHCKFAPLTSQLFDSFSADLGVYGLKKKKTETTDILQQSSRNLNVPSKAHICSLVLFCVIFLVDPFALLYKLQFGYCTCHIQSFFLVLRPQEYSSCIPEVLNPLILWMTLFFHASGCLAVATSVDLRPTCLRFPALYMHTSASDTVCCLRLSTLVACKYKHHACCCKNKVLCGSSLRSLAIEQFQCPVTWVSSCSCHNSFIVDLWLHYRKWDWA